MAHASNTHRQGGTTRTKDDHDRPPGRSPDDQATRVAAGQSAAGSQAAAAERAARGQSLSPRALSSPADHGSPATDAPSLVPSGLPACGDEGRTGLQAATIAGPCPTGRHAGPPFPDSSLDAYINDLIGSAPPLTREQRDKLALLLRTDLPHTPPARHLRPGDHSPADRMRNNGRQR